MRDDSDWLIEEVKSLVLIIYLLFYTYKIDQKLIKGRFFTNKERTEYDKEDVQMMTQKVNTYLKNYYI